MTPQNKNKNKFWDKLFETPTILLKDLNLFNPRTPGGFGRTPTPGGVDFRPPPYDLENYAG